MIKKLYILLLFFSSILLLSACGNITMEQQVESLIESNDLLERKEIAYSLADYLDTHAVELIINNHFITESRSKQAIKNMLTRYSEILKKYPSDTERAIKCVRFIADPSMQNENSLTQQKIDFIIHGLLIRNSNLNYQKTLAISATKHGNSAMVEIINEWIKNKDSKELLYAITNFQEEAIKYLSEKIVDDKDVVELLAQIGEPAVNAMINQMQNSDQSVRFAAGDVLVKMLNYHPDAVVRLTSAIDNNGVKLIAKNYPFYIRLGQVNTEEILLKALNINFSTEMCVDYLNCGSTELESGATDIARKHGYIVTPGFGGHSGPRWGSGN
jgi:hypothetical protein